jgi:hypothetical protein
LDSLVQRDPRQLFEKLELEARFWIIRCRKFLLGVLTDSATLPEQFAYAAINLYTATLRAAKVNRPAVATRHPPQRPNVAPLTPNAVVLQLQTTFLEPLHAHPVIAEYRLTWLDLNKYLFMIHVLNHDTVMESQSGG